MTSALPAEILDAHGGPAHWQRYARVDATIVSGGRLLCTEGPGAGLQSPSNDGVAARGTFIGESLRALQISARCSRLIELPSKSAMAL